MSTLILKEDGKSLEKSFENIFQNFDLLPKEKVFIKPNLSGRTPIIKGENTDPLFLKRLIMFLLKKGVKKIIICHDSLLSIREKQLDFKKMMTNGGFSFLYDIKQVDVLNFSEIEKDIVDFNDTRFSIPRILKEAQLYINLGKIKTHMETDVSLSLKNQMGLVSKANRINMHKNNLDEHIAYVGKIIKPDLSIIDGIISMEGNGPHDGSSKRLNLLAAGNDMVELDSLVSFLLGFNFRDILHINIAEKIKAGSYPDEFSLKINNKYKIANFRKADKYKKIFKNLYIWPNKSCSRCITVLKEYGNNIKKNPIHNLDIIKKSLFGRRKINIIIGRADGLNLSKEDKNICIGSCTKNCAKRNKIKNLDKCPPSVEEAIEYIKKELK